MQMSVDAQSISSLLQTFRQQKGATMLEFSLSCLVLIGIVGAVFDVGIGFRNYVLMTHTTNEAVREFAARAGGLLLPPACEDLVSNKASPKCNELGACLALSAKNALEKEMGISGDYEFLATVGSKGREFVSLEGRWPLDCFFCLLLPDNKNFTVRTRSSSLIENMNFRCANE
ncbi:MAG: hypothetical protein IT291_01145 [Deltaproteobacteria bacterium]|nr:hypothetical protein [Deltaproteobacteria bacterium]